MPSTPKTPQIKHTHPVAHAAATLETVGVPDTVPKSPARKRIPTLSSSVQAALTAATTPVIQSPASTVVSVTGTTTSTPTTTFAGMVNPPPSTETPVPPVGFVPPTAREYSGFYPSQRVLVASAQAVQDLLSFADYAAVLGSGVPVAGEIAQAVTIGVEWHGMRAPAEAWEAYVRAQYGAAWKVATTLLDELKPSFLLAAAKNPSLGLKYPGLMAIFDAPKQATTKSVATKKRNAKAKGGAAGPATTAAGAPVEPPTPPVAAEAPMPTKAITVTA